MYHEASQYQVLNDSGLPCKPIAQAFIKLFLNSVFLFILFFSYHHAKLLLITDGSEINCWVLHILHVAAEKQTEQTC